MRVDRLCRSAPDAFRPRCSLASNTLALAGCVGPAVGTDPGLGPQPKLPPPETSLIPTVNVATAVGWPADTAPTAAPGLAVKAFAANLDHPRWVYALPNGDVLVAETNAPPRPDDNKGFKGEMMGFFMKKAGSKTPSANRITLLRDGDGDGVAETRTTFLEGLNSPFGMALVVDVLYIANTDAVVKVPYQTGATRITATPQKVADLPAGTRNHHWTKNLIASRDGRKLYATVGSNSNIAENGMAEEENRAAILEIDPATGASRVFASGLRNPNGMGWQPDSGALWTVVNERDELGHNLVPDYLTSVQDNAFYGWPYSYFGAQRRHAGHAAATGPRGQGDRPGLRARLARGAAGARVLRGFASSRALSRRRFRRRARLVEPHAQVGLQGGVRAFRQRASGGTAGRYRDRFPERAGRGARTAGRGGSGSRRRVARRRRRGQYDLASDACRAPVTGARRMLLASGSPSP